MLYLLEVTYTNNKESVAVYPNPNHPPYTDEAALWSEFETKLGQAINAEAYKAEMLLGFDSTGKILERRNGDVVKKAVAYHKKDAVALSPRLITVKNSKAEGEVANQSAKSDRTALEGAYHQFMGASMGNDDVNACLAIGIEDGANIVFDDYWSRPVEVPEPTPEPEEDTEPTE